MSNWTSEKRRVELVVVPVADASNRFSDEFTLAPSTTDDDTDSKAFPDVAQMDEECRVEVTVDGDRTATDDWPGDVNDYSGLQIHVDYGEIEFTRKVA